MQIPIKYVQNLHPVFTKPKRIKIIVGGRGSTKSTAIADYVAANLSRGQLWCCARENQNSIEESVHRTILDEIDRLGLTGFTDTKTQIKHISGGRAFYRGLARNITSLKSTLSGINGLWIEEGEDLSDNSLRVLTASVRLNAKDSERLIDGEDVPLPEIIITMNRGLRTGAVAQKWLKRAEDDLARCGYYEDDTIMVVQINHTDMPRSWFLASGLEQERLDDEKRLSIAAYDHKWGGDYLDEVEDSIIKKEWFDAAIDAHTKLGIDPTGATVFSHDPGDTGNDTKGYAVRKGIHYHDIGEIDANNGNIGCHVACAKAVDSNADLFTWDCDGMGSLLREQIIKDLNGIKCEIRPYSGSGEVEDKKRPYGGLRSLGGKDKPKTNGDTFKNKRAQYYMKLADRFYKTYQAVVEKKYIDPDELISISSSVKLLDKLRSEVCGIPTVPNRAGKIQLMSKKEMKAKYGIDSPGMADCLAMGEECITSIPDAKPIKFKSLW